MFQKQLHIQYLAVHKIFATRSASLLKALAHTRRLWQSGFQKIRSKFSKTVASITVYVNVEEKATVTLGNAIVYDFTKSRRKIFMADIRHGSYYALYRVHFFHLLQWNLLLLLCSPTALQQTQDCLVLWVFSPLRYASPFFDWPSWHCNDLESFCTFSCYKDSAHHVMK